MLSLWLALPTVAALGALQVFSAVINGLIGRHVGTVRGAMIFLLVGTVLSTIIVYAVEEGLALAELAALPPYLFIPGLINMFFIITMIRVINLIGAMLMTSCLFIGKMMISLVLDHIGFLGLPIIPAGLERIGAIVVLLIGVALLGRSRQESSERSQEASTTKLMLVAVALLLGMLVGLASGLNAVLGQQVGTFTATLLFLGPGAVMLLVMVVGRQLLRSGSPRVRALKAYYLVPGSLNVLGIAGSIVFAPIVGLQILMATTFTAGVLTGMVIDRFSLFGMPYSPITATRLLAAALLAVGVYLSIFRG